MSNNITTDLSLLYDNEFDAKYNYSNRLNKEITLKDKILDISHHQHSMQRKKLKILKLVLLMGGILILITLMSASSIISKQMTTWFIIIIVLVFVIKIVILRYSKSVHFNDENKLTSQYFLKHSHDPYAHKCPKRCKPKPAPNINPKHIKEKVQNNLKTDSSLNVWLYGDQPEALYYNPRIYGDRFPNPRITEEQESLDKPRQWFNQITENTNQEEPIEGITYYNCVKDLSPKHTKTEFRTTIPCKYYPGYKTLNRCIFDENNNCNIV
jgi:hypothetical protein